MFQKSIIEVVQQADSKKNSLKSSQAERGYDWEEINVEARDYVSHFLGSKIKCAVGVSTHGERIKNTHSSNETV